MTPEVGKSYTVPSGMGGAFTARVLALYDGGAMIFTKEHPEGKELPARVHMRVVMPRNPDWHDWTFEMDREYFERVAR